MEEGLHTLLGQVFINWEGGCNKLMIVDETILIVVTLLHNLLHIFSTQFNVHILYSISQFISLYGSTKVLINFVELLSQLFEFLWVNHLDQDCQTSTSKS